MQRKVAQAYYNLGQLDRADEHLRKALELMGINVPISGSTKVKAIGTKKLLGETFKFVPEKSGIKVDPSELPHRYIFASIYHIQYRYLLTLS